MLTTEDIQWPPKKPKHPLVALAFGIDGEIVHTMVTYVPFYKMILEAKSIVCKSENCNVVDFIDDRGLVITSLSTTPLFGSLLASSPDIFVLSQRSEDNSKMVDTGNPSWYRSVEAGWKYDESGILPL